MFRRESVLFLSIDVSVCALGGWIVARSRRRASSLDPVRQDVEHEAHSARVPEDVWQGVFAGLAVIVQSRDVFAIDFLSSLTQPPRVAARVILSPASFRQLLETLRGCIDDCANADASPTLEETSRSLAATQFGADCFDSRDSKAASSSADSLAADDVDSEQLGIETVYERFKLSDKVAGGVYANATLVRRTRFEFVLDFICNLFPRAVVTSRVFMSAQRIPQLINTLTAALESYQRGAEEATRRA
jgi:hypothetical protein